LDLPLLTIFYNQKAIFYSIPTADFSSALQLLAKSLSQILVSFYPLAGRLTISADGAVCIDSNDAGVEFVEASTDDIPKIIRVCSVYIFKMDLETENLPISNSKISFLEIIRNL